MCNISDFIRILSLDSITINGKKIYTKFPLIKENFSVPIYSNIFCKKCLEVSCYYSITIIRFFENAKFASSVINLKSTNKILVPLYSNNFLCLEKCLEMLCYYEVH